jgi:hypothetical protein
MVRTTSFIVALACLCGWLCVGCAQVVEEFHVFGPTELHDAAVSDFIEMRRLNPNETIDHDSTFMKKARAQAVKRLNMQPEESISLKVRMSLSAGPGT